MEQEYGLFFKQTRANWLLLWPEDSDARKIGCESLSMIKVIFESANYLLLWDVEESDL